MKVGVAYPGNAEDVTERSGTPFGVLTGVRSHGHTAEAIVASPGRQRDRAVAAVDGLSAVVARRARGGKRAALEAYRGAYIGRRVSSVRSRVAVRNSLRLSPDVIIALGSGYETPPQIPYVIYDDMTVAQVLRAGYPAWRNARATDQEFRLEQQRRRYAGALRCCMTTSWAARSVIDDYGIAPEKVCVVGAGTHEPTRHVDRDWETPHFLFVGLNWQRKNGARVLEGFRVMREQHPEATLDVVGVHPDISQPGVQTHGRLFRDRPADLETLRGLYDRATCFVMPSLHEPGGVVFVEAAAVGVPAIGGNVGGSADFIGEAGYVVDPTDGDAITAAMLALCDGSRARALGAAAAERSRLFTWEQVAGRLLSAAGLSASDAALLPFEPHADGKH